MINKLFKSLFGLFIFGFGVINFSNASLEIPNCYSYGWGSYPCFELEIDETFTFGNVTSSVGDFFNLDTYGYKYFGVNKSSTYLYIFWYGNYIRSVVTSDYSSNGMVGTLTGFCLYNGTDYSGLFRSCASSSDNINNGGILYGVYNKYNVDFNTLYSFFAGHNLSRVYVSPEGGNLLVLCGVYDEINMSFCVSSMNSIGLSDYSSRVDLNGIFNDFDYQTDINNSFILNFYDYMSDSPLVFSSGGGDDDFGGSTGVVINNNITGDYIYSNCTYQQIFDYAESQGYNINLCYGGLDNFSLYDSSLTYNPIPGTGKTLGQILSYSQARDTPLERFNFWNGLYIDRYNNTYNAMWESYPAVYRTRFDLYYMYGGQNLVFDSVREYCAMKMLDIDFSNTYYKGQYFKNTCDYIKNNGDYPYDDVGSGDINLSGSLDNIIGVNWIGVGNFGTGNSGATVSNNPVVFIQNFFNQLKANLPTRYDLGGGFLPLYIITFMCAIILFRFLSH